MRTGIRARRILFGAAAVVALWWLFSSDEVRHPPGVLAPEEPAQTLIKEPQTWWRGTFQITPLADFDVRARVLSTARYYLGRETELSPLDLVLGWGRMSDQQVLDRLSISQSGRWFYWRSAYQMTPPIPIPEIQSHCANMHMIPAKPEIEKALKALRRGQVVRIQGQLVAVQARDGWNWRSSLSRDDTGNGSCELVWVSAVTVEAADGR